MSMTMVGLTENKYLVQSHVGQIIFSTTLDTEEKVKQYYGGTTWAKIEGKFLLGASSSYANGSTGGEASHTLSVNEMPSHTHTFNRYSGTDDSNFSGHISNAVEANDTGTLKDAVTTSSTGGSQPHNNMPPYRAVYIWERTA